jgi:hypothetical protein
MGIHGLNAVVRAQAARAATDICRGRGLPSQADAGTRTPDPFITSEVLCQLSYVGRGAPLGGAATSL